MDGGIVALELIIFFVLLVFSGLFSGSEVALFGLEGGALDDIRSSTDRASRRVARLLERPRELLVSILVLNTLVNVGAAIIAAVFTAQLAAAAGWSKTITVVVEVLVVTFILLVMSEITPKLLASRNPARFSRLLSAFILPFHRVLFPVSSLLARSTNIFGGRIKRFTRISGDDVKVMAEIGEEHGTLAEEERAMIHSIIEFGDRTVREVMISRLDIVAIPVVATLEDAFEIIRTSGYSRLPLFVDHLDNILGVIHAKDLLPYVGGENGQERIDWTRVARKPMFVPQGKKLDDLLEEFQLRKMHVAIVVDEYGGTAGLVTLENVLEEIVGEIRDESDDQEESLFYRIDDRTVRCDSRLDLDDLNDLLGLTLDTEVLDFETVGGLVFHLNGTIPVAGDSFDYGDAKFTVEGVDNNRIGNIIVTTALKSSQKAD
ncbi:MAG: HlyC/CorC family transporter [Rhodothermales bacterium]|nr:HlyC/CorC family transporter [Rhodothermales bacterium]